MVKKKFLLGFSPDIVNEPIVYRLVKDYDLKINILRAEVRELGGRLLMEVEGKAANIKEAVRFLNGQLPPREARQLGLAGERFVSMGLTFWQAGQKDRAMELTKQGVAMMDEAVHKGWLERQALAVPYNNLAEMYRAQGNHDEAHTLAAMAAKLMKDERSTGAR